MVQGGPRHRDSRSSQRVVCVIHPNKFGASETFIRAHVERLPARPLVLYGGYFPVYRNDDKPLLPSGLLQRFGRGVLRRCLPLSSQHFRNAALERYFKRHRVEAVLAEYGQTGVAVMDACLAAAVPLVVHFHGFDAFDQRVLDGLQGKYMGLFVMAASIIAPSESMRHRLLELGAPAAKVFVNPYGVDAAVFSGGNPGASPPTLVSVGRFVDKKAPHLTLLSFRRALEECRDAELCMVGDGELLEACKQIAGALGISHAVRFLGVRRPSEVATILRSARAFVQHSVRTSYGDSESLGVVFLEAGASGVPVIATRHDGIPEVVIDGETGLLVDEGDIEAMAGCMIRVLRDPHLAARLGSAARTHITTTFALEDSINNLWGAIEAAIQQHDGHTSHR